MQHARVNAPGVKLKIGSLDPAFSSRPAFNRALAFNRENTIILPSRKGVMGSGPRQSRCQCFLSTQQLISMYQYSRDNCRLKLCRTWQHREDSKGRHKYRPCQLPSILGLSLWHMQGISRTVGWLWSSPKRTSSISYSRSRTRIKPEIVLRHPLTWL